MTNLEKFISDESQNIVNMFFETGAEVKKAHYDKVKDSFTALLAEIEKEVDSWKQDGTGPRVSSWNIAIDHFKELLHPSEPKED